MISCITANNMQKKKSLNYKGVGGWGNVTYNVQGSLGKSTMQ